MNVDDVVQTGYVNTTSCNIGYDQNGHFLVLEFGWIDFTSRRVHGGVDESVADVGFGQNLKMDIVSVATPFTKNESKSLRRISTRRDVGCRRKPPFEHHSVWRISAVKPMPSIVRPDDNVRISVSIRLAVLIPRLQINFKLKQFVLHCCVTMCPLQT